MHLPSEQLRRAKKSKQVEYAIAWILRHGKIIRWTVNDRMECESVNDRKEIATLDQIKLCSSNLILIYLCSTAELQFE